MTTNSPTRVPKSPRIAIGSFMLESNAHSPVATREEFAQNVLIEPGRLLADLSRANILPAGMSGPVFYNAMQQTGAWTPVPDDHSRGGRQRPGRSAVV